MKTTIEMNGYEIVIEESEEGTLTVSAFKDGDVVEEFTLEEGEETEGGEESDGDVIKGFDKFGAEEEDFESEEDSEEDSEEETDEVQDEEELEGDEELDEEEEEESKLESFQSFINKKRK